MMPLTSSPLGKRRRHDEASFPARLQISNGNQGHGSDSSAQSYNVAQPSPAELAAYNKEYPAVPPREQIWEALASLDGTWIRTLLLQISDSQARVACEIWDEYQKRKRRKSKRKPEPGRSVDSNASAEHERQRLSTEAWVTALDSPAQELGSQAVARHGRRSIATGEGSRTSPLQPTALDADGLGFPFQSPRHERQPTTTGQALRSASMHDTPFESDSVNGFALKSPHLRQDQQSPGALPSFACMTGVRNLETVSRSNPNVRSNDNSGTIFEEERHAIAILLAGRLHDKSEQGQTAAAPDVYSEIKWIIKRVREPACADGASFALRKSAMQVLLSMGEHICCAVGALSREIRGRFRDDPCLERAMVDIMVTMSEEELTRMSTSHDGASKFSEKIVHLCKLGQQFDIYQDLVEVVKVLTGEGSNDVQLEMNGSPAQDQTHAVLQDLDFSAN